MNRRTATVADVLHWAAGRLSFVEDEVAGLGTFIRDGDSCLDIGAEYGLYTWALSARVGPRGQVHSVEPLPGPARWLQLAARTLGSANVVVHRTALGSRVGHGTLSLPRRKGLPVHGRAYLTEGAQGPGPNAEFTSSRLVRTRVHTLDQLVERAGLEKVAFVKADVEGAEHAVLLGARQTLRRHRPVLLLEIEDRHLAKYGGRAAEVVAHLGDYGYRPSRWRDGRWTEIGGISGDCRNYLFTA
ncbi:FkbM family methyltransferase [Streptomyces sp. NPDC048301]|uniref:FkbM family methyltransferase n=1 Tax=Streptomyces sp. NPDC048301 TaxID=3155631 RepID=UPI0034142CC3